MPLSGTQVSSSPDKKALMREKLIERHLPLVTFTVERMTQFLSAGVMERKDAIGYGTHGLINAIDNFDESKGCSFSSYAMLRIRGAIIDAARANDIVPRSQRKLMREVEEANWDLANQLGRSPTVKEIALRTGFGIDQIRTLMDTRGARIQSLDSASSHSDEPYEREIEDQDESIDPAAVLERKATADVLRIATGTLRERDQTIIDMRYRQGLAFRTIGQRLNISESRVSQIHLRILGSLKKTLISFDAAA
jgi:RNA polymerase sigma factor FliA